MANFFGRASVKSADPTRKNKHSMNCTFVTTMDFFQPHISYWDELIPGESRNISLQSTARTTPLVEPFFGDVRLVNRMFFVPARCIMEGWNNFETDTPYQYVDDQALRLISKVKTVTNDKLVEMFARGSASDYGLTNVYQPQTGDKYDFMALNYELDPPQLEGYRFTAKGKRFFNILRELGYVINFENPDITGADKTPMSLMPLLAYAKVYYDWYRNPAYVESEELVRYFKGATTGDVGWQAVYEILDWCDHIHLSADYFTSAWDNPITPNNGSLSPFSVPDISNVGNQQFMNQGVFVGDNTTALGPEPHVRNANTANGIMKLSDYMVQTLHKVTDFVRRKQLAGSRVLDRYMASHGIQLDSAKLDRSIYIGKDNVPLMVHDVTQNSPNIVDGTSTSEGVGEYSGKAFMQGGSNLCKSFATDEFGFLICISYIEPKVLYLNGRSRKLQHINRLHFWTAEFDGLGTQAIRVDELVCGKTNTLSTALAGYKPDGIFGWTDRYAEYAVAQDRISGDFVLPTRNADLDGWILQRDFSYDTYHKKYLNAPIIHGNWFTIGDEKDFNNIFAFRATDSETDRVLDHFYLRFDFFVDSFSPKKLMFDYPDWDSEGREMRLSVNGTQITD